MEIRLNYSERGLIGEKEVEERKHGVSEEIENIRELLRNFKKTIKKSSGQTLCFMNLSIDDFSIAVNYNSYKDIEEDCLTIYSMRKNVSETEKISYRKAAKRIMEIIENLKLRNVY